MKKFKSLALVLVSLISLASCSSSNNEKKISLTYVNWVEGIAMTHLAKAIFEEQGYKVEMLNADVAPIFASLSRKKADVFLDTWLPVTHKDYMNQYQDKLEVIGSTYENARIGLVVPDYVSISSIEELNKYKNKFSGKIVGIDAGAGIMKATEEAIQNYNLDFELMTSSGPAMTASLNKAIQKKEWIVVTGWTPHWMFNRFKLKFLEDTKKNYGETETLQVIAWKGFSKKDPFASELLSNMKFTDEQISSLMTAMNETETNEDDAALKWMNENRQLINSWIPQTDAIR